MIVVLNGHPKKRYGRIVGVCLSDNYYETRTENGKIERMRNNSFYRLIGIELYREKNNIPRSIIE
jgi:hypothetical protein